MKARPNSFLSEVTTRPPKLLVERLLAVADGEQRQAAVEQNAAARGGCPPSVTDAGPPEKITPLGCSRSNASCGGVERGDLAIDAGLAHPPGDQLRHLAAEVDDEDGIALAMGWTVMAGG